MEIRLAKVRDAQSLFELNMLFGNKTTVDLDNKEQHDKEQRHE